MFVPVLDMEPGLTFDGILLAGAQAYHRVAAQAEACELQQLANYATTQQPVDGFAAMEVAAVLKISEKAARDRLELAIALATRLPATFTAMKAGRIDGCRARIIADATRDLTPDQAAEVEEKVLPKAETQAPARLREALRRAVIKADPDAAEKRREAKRAARTVHEYGVEDGGGILAIHADATRTQTAYQRIRAIAKQLQKDDAAEGRNLDQLCSDVAMDLLAGKNFDNVQVHVWVTIPARTALGVSDQPGHVAGYGDVTAQAALELAAQSDATWRRILHDPLTGQVLDVGRRRYRPPAGLDDHVRVRTRTCTAPGCVRPSKDCDLDHVVPFPQGPTSDTNLGPDCRHHHQAKTHGKWHTEQPDTGTYRWTSPSGFKFTHQPEPIADPEPPADPDPPPF